MSTVYARVSDPKAAHALVSKVARQYRTAAGKVRTLTADAAYATDAAYESGLIGKDGEYATARDYAAAYGVSPSAVTLWRRLGRALVVGITTDSEAWQHLAFRSAANDKIVAEAIMADDATVDKIMSALGKSRKPDGTRKPSAAPGEGARPDDGTDAAPTVPVEITDPAERVKIVLGILDDECKGVAWTAEQWSAIEDKINKIVKREVTLLGKRVKAEQAQAPAA